MITENQANREIEKFHRQLFSNVIDIIKLNQKALKKLLAKENRGENFRDFHKGELAFGDVLIHLLAKEIRKLAIKDENAK